MLSIFIMLAYLFLAGDGSTIASPSVCPASIVHLFGHSGVGRVIRRRRYMVHVQGGGTALKTAAIYGHADCVRLLLDAGADKNAKDNVRVCPPRLLRECGVSLVV